MDPTQGDSTTLVIGRGEIGAPIAELLGAAYRVTAKDVEPIHVDSPIDVLHLCLPFQVPPSFVSVAVAYAVEYNPRLVIVHSTVVPGTSRAIEQGSGIPVVYSPVRGKHSTMVAQLKSFTKFVAGTDRDAVDSATAHLQGAGLKVDSMDSPEALELAKLLETAYYGLLITWAQEQQRWCRSLGVDYEQTARFTEEVDYLPPVVFQPGFIGGHCVMPNIDLLEQVGPSSFLDVVRTSNERKRQELHDEGRDIETRLTPRSRGL